MIIRVNESYEPNVLHFHGNNINELQGTLRNIFNNHIVNADYDTSKLKIVSTWTDDDKCCLYQQCKKHNIAITNCVPKDYDRMQKWYMPNKIRFFIDILKQSKEDIILFLDGYDVLLTHLDDIIERFQSLNYRVLFGPSCNNYPGVYIDTLYNRANLGHYCYLNAGCCIGYREDLLKFYEEAYKYIDLYNELGSEQFVIRIAFSLYSKDKEQCFVGIDHECKIFQSMGWLNSQFTPDVTLLSYRKDEGILFHPHQLILKDTIQTEDNKYLIVNGIYMELLKTFQISNADLLKYIIEHKLINKIYVETSYKEGLEAYLENLEELCILYEIPCVFIVRDHETFLALQQRKCEYISIVESTLNKILNI